MANRYLAQQEVSELETVRLKRQRNLDQHQTAADPAKASQAEATASTRPD